MMDSISTMYREIPLYITLYVDDGTFEAMGTKRFVISTLVAAVRRFNAILNASCRMSLNFDKNQVVASDFALAKAIAAACGEDPKLHPVQWAASLGAGIAGGRRPAFHVLRKRLRELKRRVKRFRRARKNKVSITRLHHTGASAAMTYGEGISGVPPPHAPAPPADDHGGYPWLRRSGRLR